MATATNRILRVASDSTWERAIRRAEAELGFKAAPPKPSATKKRQLDMLARAQYGPPPPLVDMNWMFTPHPYPEFQRVLVPPEASERLIREVTDNRAFKPAQIAKNYRLMMAGLWAFTNLGWALDVRGIAQDCQNRAAAAFMAGYTVDTVVFVGMPRENYRHLDQGANRSRKDTMEALHEKNASHVGTATSILMQVDQWGPVTHLNWRRFMIANDELEIARMEYAKMEGDPIQQGITWGFRIRKYVRVSVSVVGAAYLLVRRVASEKEADLFFYALEQGNTDNEAINKLRNKLIARERAGERNYDALVQLALMLKTWKLYASKLPVPRQLNFPETLREPFPWPFSSDVKPHTL